MDVDTFGIGFTLWCWVFGKVVNDKLVKSKIVVPENGERKTISSLYRSVVLTTTWYCRTHLWTCACLLRTFAPLTFFSKREAEANACKLVLLRLNCNPLSVNGLRLSFGCWWSSNPSDSTSVPSVTNLKCSFHCRSMYIVYIISRETIRQLSYLCRSITSRKYCDICFVFRWYKLEQIISSKEHHYRLWSHSLWCQWIICSSTFYGVSRSEASFL